MLYKPAMEAEDLTKEVDGMTKEVAGDDINVSNTDDIFGTKKKSGISKTKKSNPEPDPEQEKPEATNNEKNDSPTSDEGGENSDEKLDNIDGDNEMADEDVEADSEDPTAQLSEYEKKMALKKKMVQLYNVFIANITSLNGAAGDVNDNELSTMYAKSKDYMTHAKNRLFDIITIELKTDEYPVLMKKYIGLCRFHDVCIDMMDESMRQYEELSNKKIFTHKKRRSVK